MAAKVVRAVTALAVIAGLLLVPASASAQTRHASATDVCHSVTLPGVRRRSTS